MASQTFIGVIVMFILGLVFFGGLGIVLRYLLTVYCPDAPMSWGVLVANVLGSFLAGFFFVQKGTFFGQSEGSLTPILLIGLCGGLTTFSSFAIDTSRLILGSQWGLALVNLTLNNFLSVLACVLGMKIVVSSS